MVPPFVLPTWADTNLRNLPPLPLLLRLKYAPFTTFYNIHIFSSFVTRTGMTLRPARTGCVQTRTQSHPGLEGPARSPGFSVRSWLRGCSMWEAAGKPPKLHVQPGLPGSLCTKHKQKLMGLMCDRGRLSLTTVWVHMLLSRWPSRTVVCKWDGNIVLCSAFQKTAFLFCIKSQNLTFLVCTENVNDP